MIDDELHQASTDLRRQVDRLEPPPIKRPPTITGRVGLVAVSLAAIALAVFALRPAEVPQVDTTTSPTSPENQTDDRSVDNLNPDPPTGQTATDTSRVTTNADGDVTTFVPGSSASWNSDGSFLIAYERTSLDVGHVLYDGVTLERIGPLPIDPADIEQVYWHPTDPSTLVYPSGTDLATFNVVTEEVGALHSFSDCASVDTAHIANPLSEDGRLAGLRCRQDGSSLLVVVDLASDTTATIPGEEGMVGPAPSPDGSLFVTRSDSGLVKVLNPDLTPTGVEFATGTDHFALIATDDGRQLYVTTVFTTPEDAIGSLVAFDLATGQPTVVIGPDTGYPYPPSGTELRLGPVGSGLVTIAISASTDPSDQGPLDGEIALVDFGPSDPNIVHLMAHRSTSTVDGVDDYWTAPRAAVNPSGERLAYATNEGADSVDLFAADVTSG